MKYVVLIMDGAAGWPLKDQGGKTALELARTPNLDVLTQEGTLGLTETVPAGMEPSSAIACLSLLGYNPRVYYKGRAAIEAVSMGVPVKRGETIFRCNLVAIKNDRMWSYCSGHIENEDAHQLIKGLNEHLGNDEIRFYPGVGYRHLLKIRGHQDTAQAICTPPHDIFGKTVTEYLPKGRGSRLLNELMQESQKILKHQSVNYKRAALGQVPATTIWPFWGSGPIPKTPSFKETHGLSAAITSGVDLLRGLGIMMGMDILEIAGVTDNMSNDFVAQAEGAIAALRDHDLVVIHIEAPDEAGHAGNTLEKISAIEKIDAEVVTRIRQYPKDLRLLVMPDHPTPLELRTHVAEPVPFLMWGEGFKANGRQRFCETEARITGLLVANGYEIMKLFCGE
ncbi:MAG: cofactor-independent phosphoglycerate mutase [Dehalococcoidia bacterium]|nr:cofactor-independent phosphoglycerate mutase [Dehalococcoidia bacterium]